MMSTSPHSRPYHQLLYFFKNSERYRFVFFTYSDYCQVPTHAIASGKHRYCCLKGCFGYNVLNNIF